MTPVASVSSCLVVTVAAALALSACTTYVHRIEYVALHSPVEGEAWMIRSDRVNFSDKLMTCRVVDGRPFCRYFPLAASTHTEVNLPGSRR